MTARGQAGLVHIPGTKRPAPPRSRVPRLRTPRRSCQAAGSIGSPSVVLPREVGQSEVREIIDAGRAFGSRGLTVCPVEIRIQSPRPFPGPPAPRAAKIQKRYLDRVARRCVDRRRARQDLRARGGLPKGLVAHPREGDGHAALFRCAARTIDAIRARTVGSVILRGRPCRTRSSRRRLTASEVLRLRPSASGPDPVRLTEETIWRLL